MVGSVKKDRSASAACSGEEAEGGEPSVAASGPGFAYRHCAGTGVELRIDGEASSAVVPAKVTPSSNGAAQSVAVAAVRARDLVEEQSGFICGAGGGGDGRRGAGTGVAVYRYLSAAGKGA